MGFRSPIIVMGTCTLCLTCETLQGNTSTQGTDTMTHRTACGSVAMDICSTRQLSVYATVSLLRTSEAVEPPNHAVERTGHSGHPWLAWGGTVWPSAHRQRSASVMQAYRASITIFRRTKIGRKTAQGRRHHMKVREVVRLLTNDGWEQVSQKGSHRQFKHATKAGKVTVPGKLSDDVPIGTLKSILRQAGLEK